MWLTRLRWAVPLGIAATFATVLAFEGGASVAWLGSGCDRTTASGKDAGSDEEVARRVRDQARQAYARGSFTECINRLDEARAIDPAGEVDPAVGRLRQNAVRLLLADAGVRMGE